MLDDSETHTRQDPTPTLLDCHYFGAGKCRSCSLIETPYARQLSEKTAQCRALLPSVADSAWLPPYTAGDRGFRNRVKLVVGGRTGDVTLGILDRDGRGVDLRECAIQAPEISMVLPALAEFLNETGLAPYDVPKRRGELKFAHLTVSPSGDKMLRFVVRSQHGRDVLRSRLERLRQLVPSAAVISVNLLPEHKAVLEGEHEEMLLGTSLAMGFGALTLHLQPKSFFQTNTAVAQELYAQVAAWVAHAAPASVWDLYCGVGGFALHCAQALRAAAGLGVAGQRSTEQGSAQGSSAEATACDIVGVEMSDAAIESAQRSARESGLGVRFLAGDATEFAIAAAPADRPELLIVNPPRRGIGLRLAEWVESSGVPCVVYSSCNPATLASDLAAMPDYAVRSARVFDMFPHTGHLEVAVLLERIE